MWPFINTSDLVLYSLHFLPELALCVGIVLLLLIPLLGAARPRGLLIPGLALAGLGFVLLMLQSALTGVDPATSPGTARVAGRARAAPCRRG